MDVLFIGDESVCPQFSEVTGKTVEFTGEKRKIADVKEIIMADSHRYICVDLSTLDDHFSVIADEMYKLSLIKQARFIFYYLGKSPKSEMVTALVDKGFGYIVMDGVRTRSNAQLKSCFDGYATVLPPDEPTEDGEPEPVEEPKPVKNVSVIGCCRRIGTTTQAIQIVKYLQSLGYKACYIEANENGFVSALRNLYTDSDVDEETKCLTVAHTDLYADASEITAIKSKGYDYCVFDYGVFDGAASRTMAFLASDYSVVVGGFSPSELPTMQPILASPIIRGNVSYVFSFVHDNDKNEVLELMNVKAENTFFAKYTPDPFTYTSATNELYGSILGNTKPAPQRKSRHGLFGRARKK